MSTRRIAEALHRVETVLRRKPEVGQGEDTPASARWQGGAGFTVVHSSGVQVATDMPTEFGGAGGQVTPGWLFRAGLATCAATSILLAAAARGIEMTMLEVDAGTRSDARGLLGMDDADGAPVYGGFDNVELRVRIRAEGVSAEQLRDVVAAGIGRSPVPNVVTHATPIALQIDVVVD